MVSFRRTPRLPGPVADRLPPGDRALAAAVLASGDWAVVTPAALVVVGEDGVQQRHPWHEIQHGAWDGDDRRLTVTWVEGARPPLVLTTADDEVERFTTALREHVQSSVVHVEAETLPSGTVIQVHVRRDEAGELFSQLTARGPLTGDVVEQRAVDALERRARAAAGMAG